MAETCAPCGRFEIDLNSIEHNKCRTCGFLKSAHAPLPMLASPELRRKLSKRDSINESIDAHDGDSAATRRGDVRPRRLAMPCGNFRRDLSGLSFDSCVCGYPKSDHENKELTSGASRELREKLRGASLRDFDADNEVFIQRAPNLQFDGNDSDDEAEVSLFCGGPAPSMLTCNGFFS